MSADSNTSEQVTAQATILDRFTSCLALVAAAECGLLEQLARGPVDPGQVDQLVERAELLGWLMVSAGLAESGPKGLVLSAPLVNLSEQERAALVERARFTLMAAEDLIAGRRAFFTDPAQFFARARTFGFFCYGRARETRLANIQDTEAWVNYVSALNAVEAPVLTPMVPVAEALRVLEIGGNAGGFALAMLDENPELRAVVMDLPAVCEIGKKRTAGLPNSDRLSFVAGDATRDAWPDVNGRAPDLICFKSVLHDWDDENATRMLEKAIEKLPPGGQLAIVERGRVEDAPASADFGLAANLVFAGFYRPPAWYEAQMAQLGMLNIGRQSCELDLPFHVVTGRKAG